MLILYLITLQKSILNWFESGMRHFSIFRTQVSLSLRHLVIFGLLLCFISIMVLFKSGHLTSDPRLIPLRFTLNPSYPSSSSFSSSTPSIEDISFTPQSLQDPSLDYRRELERTTSPPGFQSHHPTMGFDHIYCISLPERFDRRQTMEKIANALGVRLTFVDAISKTDPLIGWISEKAFEVRREKIQQLASQSGLRPDQIGGMGVGSIWLTVNGGDRANQEPLRDVRLPSLNGFHPELGGKNWVDYLWSVTDHDLLRPMDPNFNVTEAMWDHKERIPQRQINSATVSTFYNHVKTVRLIRENQDQSALVLEDDVDLEWDLERRWRTIQRRLPLDWETVFLGHCWGREIFGEKSI